MTTISLHFLKSVATICVALHPCLKKVFHVLFATQLVHFYLQFKVSELLRSNVEPSSDAKWKIQLLRYWELNHGIISWTRTETRKICSHMFVMAKKLKSCLPLLLNGITASVRCVSFVLVVQNAKFSDRLRLTQTKKMMRNEKKPTKVMFFC